MSIEYSVLVVDDSDIMRRLMKQYLGQSGISRTFEAEGGEKGLGLWKMKKLTPLFPIGSCLAWMDWGFFRKLEGMKSLKISHF